MPSACLFGEARARLRNYLKALKPLQHWRAIHPTTIIDDTSSITMTVDSAVSAGACSTHDESFIQRLAGTLQQQRAMTTMSKRNPIRCTEYESPGFTIFIVLVIVRAPSRRTLPRMVPDRLPDTQETGQREMRASKRSRKRTRQAQSRPGKARG